MPNFNQIMLMGHLGGDPELSTVNDKSVVNCSMAVNTGYGDKKNTTWYRLTLWGKNGESFKEYMGKGKPVLVVGEHSIRTYKDKEGDEKYSNDVTVSRWTFASSKDDSEQPTAGGEGDTPF